MMVRERRFAQLLEQKTLVYFKEFGASRDLNRTTGKWAAPGAKLPVHLCATEIMHFMTPYSRPLGFGGGRKGGRA
jgi:capsid portal protein